jgi:hypothetical protein
MPYLICNKCGGYYKLNEGESLNDFEECECGGSLRQVESLNIPYNTERVKTIVEVFNKDFRKIKGKRNNEKLSISVDYTDGLHKLLKEDRVPKKDISVEMQRSAYKEVALLHELYNLDYIDPIDDYTKQIIINILAEIVYDGRGIIDATNKILSKTKLSYEDAEKISKNELNRIKNLGNWYVYKEKGFKYFKISKAIDACNKCQGAYDKKIFKIDQSEMLPPLHDLCTCKSIFYREKP